MESTINERIAFIISKLGYKSKRAFAEKIGIAQTSFNDILKGAEPKYSTLNKILIAEPLISPEWLITGEGEMLKSCGDVIGSAQDNGKIEYRNKGNVGVGVGNMINVALPESGTQKIIKPDGSVEIHSNESNDIAFDLKKENDSLKEKISLLQDNMKVKDELIVSLRETIELLKHKQ